MTRLWPRSEHPGPFDDEKKKYREAGSKKKKKKLLWSRAYSTLIQPDYSEEDANLARSRADVKRSVVRKERMG